ncbi:hypothetical protein ACNKHL_11730 [Shigella flexneri]
MKQIEDLTREAMGFLKNAVTGCNVVNSPFNSSEESGGELPFWQQTSVYRSVTCCRSLVAGTAGGVAAWRKAVRPQLTRRAEAMKAVQQQQGRPARKWKMRWKSA